MNWLRQLFVGSPPWTPEVESLRIRPLRFRQAEPADFGFCESLHAKNEQFGVPINHRAFYADALRSSRMLTFVAEDGGLPVGTCAIQRSYEEVYWLCYSLVSPSLHRTGIGTTMFLARLAMLPAGQPNVRFCIGISALESSLSFYRRLGFRFVGRQDYPDGNRYPIAYLDGVDARLIARCRVVLASGGAAIPYESIRIPDMADPVDVPAGWSEAPNRELGDLPD